jgi:hypothetical protein
MSLLFIGLLIFSQWRGKLKPPISSLLLKSPAMCIRGTKRDYVNYVDSNRIQNAVKFAQTQDQEWLLNNFGDNYPGMDVDVRLKSDQDGSSSNSVEIHSDVIKDFTNMKKSKKAEGKLNIDNNDDDCNVLFELGYTPNDILMIRANLRSILVNRRVGKPRQGLPQEWLNTPIHTDIGKKQVNVDYNDKLYATKLESTRGAKDIVVDSSHDVYASHIDDSYEPSFWPELEEFKDMLILESRFRVDMAGDWTTPFVREETKWRYKLYKRWLNFLAEDVDVDHNDYDHCNMQEKYDDSDICSHVGDYNRNYITMGSNRLRKRFGNDENVKQMKSLHRESEFPRGPKVRNRFAMEYEQSLKDEISKTEDWTYTEDEERITENLNQNQKRTCNVNTTYESWFQDDATYDIKIKTENDRTCNEEMEQKRANRSVKFASKPKKEKMHLINIFEESDDY